MFQALEEILTHSCSNCGNVNFNGVGLEHTQYKGQHLHVQENQNKTQSQTCPRAGGRGDAENRGLQKPFLFSLCPLVVTVQEPELLSLSYTLFL